MTQNLSADGGVTIGAGFRALTEGGYDVVYGVIGPAAIGGLEERCRGEESSSVILRCHMQQPIYTLASNFERPAIQIFVLTILTFLR